MAAEKNFENKIKKYLEDHNYWYIKYFANSYTKSGIPDILACINGYFVAIEVKASNGKPSELQFHHRRKIRESGGISIILYPEQWNDFTLLIDDLINRPQYLDWDEQRKFD
jgi:hypothetical protein